MCRHILCSALTFASLSNLNTENAIIISEGDHLGKIFFKDLYQTMKAQYL